MQLGIQRNSLLWKNGSGRGGGCEYNNWGPGGDHHSCRGSGSVSFPDASLMKRVLLTQRCCSFGSVCFQPSGSKSCWRKREKTSWMGKCFHYSAKHATIWLTSSGGSGSFSTAWWSICDEVWRVRCQEDRLAQAGAKEKNIYIMVKDWNYFFIPIHRNLK